MRGAIVATSAFNPGLARDLSARSPELRTAFAGGSLYLLDNFDPVRQNGAAHAPAELERVAQDITGQRYRFETANIPAVISNEIAHGRPAIALTSTNGGSMHYVSVTGADGSGNARISSGGHQYRSTLSQFESGTFGVLPPLIDEPPASPGPSMTDVNYRG